MTDQSNLVCVGLITRPHGVKGHVCVKSYCDDPLALFEFSVLSNKTGDKTYKLEFVGTTRDVFTAKVNGITDRNDAELLNLVELYVDRDELPELENDSEFYITDLENKSVKAFDGTEFGTIISVVNFGASDMMEVKEKGENHTIYIPFLTEYIPVVDLNNGYVQLSEEAHSFIEQMKKEDKE